MYLHLALMEQFFKPRALCPLGLQMSFIGQVHAGRSGGWGSLFLGTFAIYCGVVHSADDAS